MPMTARSSRSGTSSAAANSSGGSTTSPTTSGVTTMSGTPGTTPTTNPTTTSNDGAGALNRSASPATTVASPTSARTISMDLMGRLRYLDAGSDQAAACCLTSATRSPSAPLMS